MIITGVGDTIRGAAMDFVDSATGTARRRHPETDIGQQVETGINRVTDPSQTHSIPPGKETANNQAPPLPARQEKDATNDAGVPNQVQDDKNLEANPAQGTIGTSVV